MLRTMLKSKIHRATVTQCDLHYVGSVTVDEELMDAADLLAGERVAVVDVTNGARLETYVIPGERGSGVLGINGAAAHLVSTGDLVILISYATVDDAEARRLRPRVVFVDEANRVVERGADPAHAPPGSGLRSGTSAPGTAAGSQGADQDALGEGAVDSAAEGAVETADAARLDALIQSDA